MSTPFGNKIARSVLCYNRCATTSAFWVAGRKNQRSSLEKRHKRLRNRFASLENNSSRPHSVHPRAHTPEEVNLIPATGSPPPGIGLNESYAKLLDKVYPRNFLSLNRSNRIPNRVLTSSDSKKHWLTPIQKRQDLLPTANTKKFSDFFKLFCDKGLINLQNLTFFY